MVHGIDRDDLITETAAAVARLLGPLLDAARPPLRVDRDECARLVGLSGPALDRLVKAGLVPSSKPNRRRLFDPVAVAEAIDRIETGDGSHE